MKFFTAKQVSELLQLDLETVYSLIKRRQLTAVQVGLKADAKLPHYRVTEADLQRFIETRTLAPVEEKPKVKPGRKPLVKVKDHFAKAEPENVF